MRTNKLLAIAGLFLVWIASSTAGAQENREIRNAAILTAMSESAVSEATIIQDLLRSDDIKSIELNSNYTDRDFLLRLDGATYSGKEIHIAYTGFVWDQADSNMYVSFGGTGVVGEEAVRLNGQSIWIYDQEKKDYLGADFRIVTKFGDHSFWGWVLGTETIVGGTVGAMGAVATATIATGGAAAGASFWIGAGGALAGSTALISASDAAKNLLESNEPPPPPTAPTRPQAPQGNLPLSGKGKIYTALVRDGSLFASSNGQQILQGKFDSKVGQANGQIRSEK